MNDPALSSLSSFLMKDVWSEVGIYYNRDFRSGLKAFYGKQRILRNLTNETRDLLVPWVASRSIVPDARLNEERPQQCQQSGLIDVHSPQTSLERCNLLI